MQFKSNTLTLHKEAWSTSLGLHAICVALVLSIILWPEPKKEIIDIDVIENPKAAAAAQPIQILKPKPKPEAKEKPKPVFGISKDTLTTDTQDASAVEVKAGNTLAKEADNIKIDPSKALPIPTDEFLVTAMPRLKNEVRIPYPPEAKKKGIQGPVVMDLLIDSEGKVRDVQLVSTPSTLLSDAAVVAIRNFQFLPAKIKDQSVSVKIRYSYRFVLER